MALTNQDARRAIKWLREHAASPSGDTLRHIGIIGLSAGVYVSLLLALDEPEFRPDFAGVIYGPDNKDKSVPDDAPPIFIAVASDDTWSAPSSLKLFQNWQEAGRPAELHAFQTGGHGFLNQGGGADFFMDRFAEWMRANGWLEPGEPGTGSQFR